MGKIALFHRDYLGFTGGHKKVWDYFNHVQHHGYYHPRIFLTERSLAEHLWSKEKRKILSHWAPEHADLLFLAGHDWSAIPSTLLNEKPIINLIQGMRHADPMDPLFQFLKNKAIRICVSQPIADAILSTKQVNGPVFVIPNGIDLPKYTKSQRKSILIVALKNPSKGLIIHKQLTMHGHPCELLTHWVPPKEFQRKILHATSVIFITEEKEGFYLPALEAMALGTPVLLTDAIGNRQYTEHNHNCLIIHSDNVLACVQQMQHEWKRFRDAGLETAKKFTLKQEYEKFSVILNSLTPPIRKRLATNVILTGIPRSGTTLTCALLNKCADTVALEEPIFEGQSNCLRTVTHETKNFFKNTRSNIHKTKQCLSRHLEGQFIDNYLSDTLIDGKRIPKGTRSYLSIQKPLSQQFSLIVKRPSLFTALLSKLISIFPCYAIIRNPLAVLASWHTTPFAVKQGFAPKAQQLDGELSVALANIETILERQLFLIDWFFKQYHKYLSPHQVIRYEDIIMSKGLALNVITPHARYLNESLLNKNANPIYPKEHMIHLAEKLLANRHASYWHFYTPHDIQSVFS